MTSGTHFHSSTSVEKLNKTGVVYINGDATSIIDSWRLLPDLIAHKILLQHRTLVDGSWTTHSDLVGTNFNDILVDDSGDVISDEAGNIVTSPTT